MCKVDLKNAYFTILLNLYEFMCLGFASDRIFTKLLKIPISVEKNKHTCSYFLRRRSSDGKIHQGIVNEQRQIGFFCSRNGVCYKLEKISY